MFLHLKKKKKVIIFYNITVFMYFDQIHEAFLSRRDFKNIKKEYSLGYCQIYK